MLLEPIYAFARCRFRGLSEAHPHFSSRWVTRTKIVATNQPLKSNVIATLAWPDMR